MVEYVQFEERRTVKLYKFGRYSFSMIEIKHLGLALILITIAMMVLQKDSSLLKENPLAFILLYFLTIGLGFLLHELGHKLVAQRYGFISEFRADFMMMLVAIGIAYFGFLFIAPGAVMILGRPTKKQNGIISVAGPLVNLALAIIFIIMSFFVVTGSFLSNVVFVGIWVNSILGVFNMLPFWVLDGKKVLAWNKSVYFLVMAALILILLGAISGVFI